MKLQTIKSKNQELTTPDFSPIILWKELLKKRLKLIQRDIPIKCKFSIGPYL
jgi:hypothetical protein